MEKPYEYPLLKRITQIFADQKGAFDDTYILACQHILEPQAKMFELIADFGVPKQNIRIFGKIYSTSQEVLNELSQKGFDVFQAPFDPAIPFDMEHAHNCAREFEAFISKLRPSSRFIIMDDGGELLKYANNRFEQIPSSAQAIGIEQTSSGFRKLEAVHHSFPILNVARSDIKLTKESPLIAQLGCDRILSVFKRYSIDEPRILVVGLGPIGKNVLSILSNDNYFVTGYDTALHGKKRLINLLEKDRINTLIGATGSIILDEDLLEEIISRIRDTVYLVSMSSSDREFPAVQIRRNSATSNTIHSDMAWKNVVLINNGFPITFKGNRLESSPTEIEPTIGLLYGSVLESLTSKTALPAGLQNVPEKIAREL